MFLSRWLNRVPTPNPWSYFPSPHYWLRSGSFHTKVSPFPIYPGTQENTSCFNLMWSVCKRTRVMLSRRSRSSVFGSRELGILTVERVLQNRWGGRKETYLQKPNNSSPSGRGRPGPFCTVTCLGLVTVRIPGVDKGSREWRSTIPGSRGSGRRLYSNQCSTVVGISRSVTWCEQKFKTTRVSVKSSSFII